VGLFIRSVPFLSCTSVHGGSARDKDVQGRRWAPGGACRGAATVGEGGRSAGLGRRVADVLEFWLAVLAARYRRRRTR
jgi:hypothetical protein